MDMDADEDEDDEPTPVDPAESHTSTAVVSAHLKYDLAFLIVCFILITYIFRNVQKSRSFGTSFKFPEGSGAPEGSYSTAPGSANVAFAANVYNDDLCSHTCTRSRCGFSGCGVRV